MSQDKTTKITDPELRELLQSAAAVCNQLTELNEQWQMLQTELKERLAVGDYSRGWSEIDSVSIDDDDPSKVSVTVGDVSSFAVRCDCYQTDFRTLNLSLE